MTKKKGEFIIGLDLGGTKISAAALSADGSQMAGLRSIDRKSVV